MPSNIEAALQRSEKTTLDGRNILAFHKLSNQLTFGSTNYSPRRFSKLVQKLSEHGFEFVSLQGLLTGNNSNEMAITFDDGYAHLMQSLPPLIEKFAIKPTIFVPTAYIGKRNSWDYSSLFKSERHLNESEIKELSNLGVEFGSHAHTHTDLSQCSHTALSEELKTSKVILETLVNYSVDSISYPFGRYDSRVLKMAAEVGYKNGFTMRFPSYTDSTLTCGRIPVYFFDNSTFVKQKLGNGRRYALHRRLGSIINSLSYGTVLFNRLTKRESG